MKHQADNKKSTTKPSLQRTKPVQQREPGLPTRTGTRAGAVQDSFRRAGYDINSEPVQDSFRRAGYDINS
jgi:hypothetical protein